MKGLRLIKMGFFRAQPVCIIEWFLRRLWSWYAENAIEFHGTFFLLFSFFKCLRVRVRVRRGREGINGGRQWIGNGAKQLSRNERNLASIVLTTERLPDEDKGAALFTHYTRLFYSLINVSITDATRIAIISFHCLFVLNGMHMMPPCTMQTTHWMACI